MTVTINKLLPDKLWRAAVWAEDEVYQALFYEKKQAWQFVDQWATYWLEVDFGVVGDELPKSGMERIAKYYEAADSAEGYVIQHVLYKAEGSEPDWVEDLAFSTPYEAAIYGTSEG